MAKKQEYKPLSHAALFEKHYKRYLKETKGWSNWRITLPLFSKRWAWWCLVLEKKALPDLEYPQISFANDLPEQAEPFKMIQGCVNQFSDVYFVDFLDWVLFNFGDREFRDGLPSRIEKKHIKYWKENFDLKLLFEHPGDWFGQYYQAKEISKKEAERDGLFLTPNHVAQMMTDMIINKNDLLSSVNDPCVGSGRFLLSASNYSINLTGQDKNPNMTKICKINGWLYMPSLVMPCPDLFKGERP